MPVCRRETTEEERFRGFDGTTPFRSQAPQITVPTAAMPEISFRRVLILMGASRLSDERLSGVRFLIRIALYVLLHFLFHRTQRDERRTNSYSCLADRDHASASGG